MDPVGIVIWLTIGAVSGWLAGVLMKGYGFGLLGNIILGIIGAFVGGFLFSLSGLSLGPGLVGSIVTSVVGAIVTLLAVGFIKKAT